MEPEDYWRINVPDTFVCHNCFHDYAIRDFIKKEASGNHCDYCDRRSGSKISVPLEQVLELIKESIELEWEDPANSVSYESAEGGYIGADIKDADELMDIENLVIDSDELRQEVLNTISDHQWCKIDPYGPYEHERLIWTWEYFCHLTKHVTRYFFHSQPANGIRAKVGEILTNPYDILHNIASFIGEIGLINKLFKETNIFRVRTSKGVYYNTLRELGPPSQKEAKFSNRWSPAGIPMFYGAYDRKTAILETYNSDKTKKYATIATLKIEQNIRIIDFTNLPSLPSMFDHQRRQLRQAIVFLKDFLDDVSRQVIKDGMEHIDYIPTQIVAEYFKHNIDAIIGHKVMGIAYRSSQNIGGICIVLFLGNSEDKEKGLLSESIDDYLSLSAGSVEHSAIDS